MYQIILGLILADIGGGMAHWFEDTYIHYCSKIPGMIEIAKHNELHHYFPRAMLKGSYFENIQTSILFACILFILLFCVLPKTMFHYPFLFITLFIFLSLVNLFHRFAHERECETPSIIYKLQSVGLLCSHDHHRQHHVKEIDGKYCTIFPITNYLLDSIYFWRFLEKIISMFGINPSRKPKYNYYTPIQNYMHQNAKTKCPLRPQEHDINELFNNLDNFIQCDS